MYEAKRILVFRVGQLGDMLVSVPAMWALRKYFRNAHITLLCDNHPGKGYITSSDVFNSSGIVDDIVFYPAYSSGNQLFSWLRKMFLLLRYLRSKRYDLLVYLVSCRGRHQIRDTVFFRLAGIKRFIGIKEFQHLPKQVFGSVLPVVQQEGDLLLDRLRRSGIPIPPLGRGQVYLNIGEKENTTVKQWLENLSSDGNRRWIAVGAGSKMPVKIWPTERYAEVVKHLIKEFDIWPVVFGGSDDKELGQFLIKQWARGYNAAGVLSVREGIAALAKCVLYIGNDTGVIHMAAAAGIKCVGIYSARDYPGNWHPYGHGHIVLRNRRPCEGCMLEVCSERKAECIMSIHVNDVFQACAKVLREELQNG
jgi:heptosyltransferase III